eukprot:CAMPEP_0202687794 /NCGR_PEP_ID=MMETSP1385-20130828/3407_1 /ASSEMBLY_ACC=CAM_ASM_000861 /TAXON_ID=933848 /ORGANISM="Elphidium margaritaceum" /LENGTH=425 /DNA_ID=CAMNT_0049342641 /DNA_START=43 /DNA_END=1320 /DNA_ORIENTATION=-
MSAENKSQNDDSALSSPSKTSFPKSRIKILLMEKISQKAVDLFVNEGYTVETANIYTPEQLAEVLPTVHMIGVRSKTKLTSDLLTKYAKKLLCVGCFCIGTDQTDLSVAASLGIPVFNSPFANTRSVAELMISNIIALSRKLGDQNKWMHAGQWKKTAAGCYEVRGKTLGIVGYGHVGSQLSVLAEAMGLRVLFYDVLPKMALGNAVAANSLQQVLKTADFVSLHVPYTKSTHMMIDEAQILMMKKGSYILNAARGKCVNIETVAKYLKNGYLAGAYFDVYPKEPTNDTLPLCNCPNTILSPHIGGSTLEAQSAIGVDVASKIVSFINEGATIASVNFPEVSLEPNSNVHRVLHVHRNVPGVLRKINGILGDFNVVSQVLKTTPEIGYLLVEVEANAKFSSDVKKKMSELPETIRTRVLYSPGTL